MCANLARHLYQNYGRDIAEFAKAGYKLSTTWMDSAEQRRLADRAELDRRRGEANRSVDWSRYASGSQSPAFMQRIRVPPPTQQPAAPVVEVRAEQAQPDAGGVARRGDDALDGPVLSYLPEMQGTVSPLTSSSSDEMAPLTDSPSD